jgi:hypothetical protein
MNYPLMYPDYHFAIVIYIVLENMGRETSGSNLRQDTVWCTPEKGFAGPKTDRLYHNDRRVQTIINEITLQSFPLLKRFQ